MASNKDSLDGFSEEFSESLRRVYSNVEANENVAELEFERSQLERILPRVAEQIAGNYEFDLAIDRGGAGVVFRVVDINLTKVLGDQSRKIHRALKVARPIEDREKLLNSLIAKEFKTLASLTHSNVIKLYYAGSILDGDLSRPFYVMDYVEGAITLLKYVRLPAVTTKEFVALLRDMVTGIAFLFSQEVAHNDLKPSNLLVGSGRAIISDLGSAIKLLDTDDPATITFTAEYAHPDKRRNAVRSSDANRMRMTLPTRDIKMVWDLYSLGLTILELLTEFAAAHPDGIGAYEYRYIRLLGSRLLDGHIPPERFRYYDFPKAFYQETKYGEINEILIDLAKLTGEFKLEKEVPELDFFSGENIQVAQHGQTPTSRGILAVIAHPAFKRLSSISQLGLIVYVYPSATHTRAEHSLGTYGNTARMIYALWNDPTNPVFRQIMGKEDLLACLLAGLLHDLGQYPLAHDLGEASTKIFDHDELGSKFAAESIEGEPSLNALIDDLWRATGGPRLSQRLAGILSADVADITQPIRDRILHSVIDGPIDADKLDYLVRDSKKLNVPYGLAIDFERLSKVMTVIHERKDDYLWAAVGVHEKGKVSAESVAFARYALFGAVYWHRTSRSIKAMLHYAAWELLSRIAEDGKANFRRDFMNVIVTNRLPPLQPDLFTRPEDARMKQALWPGINLADLQMLAFLWQRCGPKGKRLVEDLARRSLYKRVLVISREKGPDIWSKAKKFADTASPESRITLDERVQEKLVRYLQELSNEEKSQTTAFAEKNLEVIYRLEEEYPLVLVDIPKEPTAGMYNLKFFGETDRWRYHTDELVRIRVEKSTAWSSIVESFGESVGKIRVFVHPDMVETVRAIDRSKLESFLLSSLPTK